MAQKERQLFRESYGKNQDLVGKIYYDDGNINCFTRITRKGRRQPGYYFTVSPLETSGGLDTSRRFPALTMLLEPSSKFSKADLQRISPNTDQMQALMSAINAVSKKTQQKGKKEKESK